MSYDEYPVYADIPEPGVMSAFGHGFKQLWPNFLMLFLVLIVSWLFAIPSWILSAVSEVGSNMANGSDGGGQVAGAGLVLIASLCSMAYSLLVMNPLNYGASYCYLRAARNERVEIAHMFAVFGNYLSAVAAVILVGLVIMLGLIFLIIPGIYFACKLAFVPFLVVDKKLGPIQAMQESWEMTNGHALTVFLMGLLSIPIMFAGLLCLIVGLIPAGMWIALSYASLYYALDYDDTGEETIYV